MYGCSAEPCIRGDVSPVGKGHQLSTSQGFCLNEESHVSFLTHQSSGKDLFLKELMASSQLPPTSSRKGFFFPVSLVICEIWFKGRSQQNSKDQTLEGTKIRKGNLLLCILGDGKALHSPVSSYSLMCKKSSVPQEQQRRNTNTLIYLAEPWSCVVTASDCNCSKWIMNIQRINNIFHK